MINVDLKDVELLARKHLCETHGLVFLIILVSAIEIVFFLSYGISLFVGTSVFVLSISGISYAWKRWNIPRKTKKDKIGVAVCIAAGSDEESVQLKKDFLDPLHRLLKGGSCQDVFDFIEVPRVLPHFHGHFG